MSEEATTTETDAPDAEVEEVADTDREPETESEERDGELDGEEADEQSLEADALEEVEWEGKKVQVPADIKAALMRTADYTRKTQEVAETRKALETERTAWQAQQAAQTEALDALAEDIGKASALKTQIAAFKDVVWADAYREAALSDDPKAATREVEKAESHFKALQSAAEAADKTVTTKREELRLQGQTALAEAQKETAQTLAKDIPNWGKETAEKILEVTGKHGITIEDLAGMDARAWKFAHYTMGLEAENAQLKAQLKGKAAVDRHATAAATTPAAPIKGAGAPATGLSDRLSADEWAKRRNAQLAKRRAG